MAHDRVKSRDIVNTVMKDQIPRKAGNFLISGMTISSPKLTQLHGINY
jgi:hypothetical protein